MSKPLIPAQRRDHIQEYLAIHKIARSTDLSDLLDVSEATIRRDLEWLENGGLLERTHGGAILNQRIPLEAEYIQRTQRFPEQKRRIGIAAASQIKDGDIVFINSGTTTTQVIRHIRSNVNIIMVTNNLAAVLEIGEVDYEIIVAGGAFQSKSNSVGGRFAIENLGQVYATKAFICVDGMSIKYGCTVPTNSEAEVVRVMIQRTKGPVTMLADHSKWGMVSNFEVAQIDQFHQLITDEKFDENASASLNERSVKVLIAE